MASIKFDTYKEQLETIKELCITLTKKCKRFAETTTNSPHYEELKDIRNDLRKMISRFKS